MLIRPNQWEISKRQMFHSQRNRCQNSRRCRYLNYQTKRNLIHLWINWMTCSKRRSCLLLRAKTTLISNPVSKTNRTSPRRLKHPRNQPLRSHQRRRIKGKRATLPPLQPTPKQQLLPIPGKRAEMRTRTWPRRLFRTTRGKRAKMSIWAYRR